VGNLYGTTFQGGTYGYGTVFKLTPSGAETILHNFGTTGDDGTYPYAGVILNSKGILYGTTHLGGRYDYGTVFKLTPSGTETLLHSFDPNGKDGKYPYSGLVLGQNENLYGTTAGGGVYGYGTVFKLTSSGPETILHSFGATGDGAGVYTAPVLDEAGNLYGTTSYGGVHQEGTVFEVTPSGTETVLWSFGNGKDGTYPNGLVFNAKGNLFGTTQYGGARGTDCNGMGCGTVFKLRP
jgi:uncharacterized repeat protein (TIGR03803 family)